MDRVRNRLRCAALAAACLVLILALAPAAQAAEAFHAPAEPTGSLPVKLFPTEVVAPGQPVIVTFGVPFPRGSLTVAQLATVRVLRNGSEIPAVVEQLTPW